MQVLIYAVLAAALFGTRPSRTCTTTRISRMFITSVGIDPEIMGFCGDAYLKVAA